VPYMIEKRRGSIINMSSTIAEIGLAQRASYAASKGAILALTRAMQVDYAPFGIRVNALLPGTIHTPFVEKYLRESYPNREEGLKAIRAALDAITGPELDPAQVELAAPAESQEVWAAGVTYLRSREARLEETTQKSIYEHVYESDRPELFFKAAGWRVVPHEGEIGVREDSTWDVPEPELAVLSNARGEVVAFACGN